MSDISILSQLLISLPVLKDFHAPSCEPYKLLQRIARNEVEIAFSSKSPEAHIFAPFGELIFPYASMGTIDSLDLFGIDELIIFSFYWANRNRYKRTLDMGANIGLHSIVMSRCGFAVSSFEPDPNHFTLLTRNIESNHADCVAPVNAAVSIKEGVMEFVRVLGNTTGSHLAGSKSKVYGGVDRFPVQVLPFADLIRGVDFVKMDVEGHERVIIESTSADQWNNLDMMVEIGSAENAFAVFSHLKLLGVNMFAQKINWMKVERLDDMPTSYHDGSLFITSKPSMPWN